MADSELPALRYSDGKTSFVGRIASPSGAGPHPAVLIAHEIDGLGQNVRRRARMLAELGYVALAADVYGDGKVYDGAEARAHGEPLLADRLLLRRRIASGLEALRQADGVDPARVAAIGYCFGGATVLELARSGTDIAAVASFHGVLSSPLPAAAGAISCPVLVAHGDADPIVPPEQLAAFEAEMAAAGVRRTLLRFAGARHAFTIPSIGAGNDVMGYDAAADAMSWAALLALLRETIG